MIFGHQHRCTQVDPQHILIVPTTQRIECIDKSIPGPGSVSITAADVAQHPHAVLVEKRERSSRCAWHNAAVNRALWRRTTPRRVAFRVIGRADSPKVFAVIRKPSSQREAK